MFSLPPLPIPSALVALLLVIALAAIHVCVVIPYRSSLYILAGPPVTSWFGGHLRSVLEPSVSNRAIDIIIRRYGRTVRIRGLGPWDDRLLTLDSLSLSHVLKYPDIYQKPWQSRSIIENLIGTGILAAEGQMHKRHRKVVSPAFSPQNMRELVPLVFRKGAELRDRIDGLVSQGSFGDKGEKGGKGTVLDICHWVSRATFDVIGIAGFDYNFDAIQSETNELFLAYKDMFEVSISQGSLKTTMLGIYIPFIRRHFPDSAERTVQRCLRTIERVASQLIEEKKQKILEGQRSGTPYMGKDLLTLLLKSNLSTDLDPSQRISDLDMLHNINTFMFAGSDTSSLSLAWTFLLLAQHPEVQTRLREELLALLPKNSYEDDDHTGDGGAKVPGGMADLSSLSTPEIHSLYESISKLPYLHNVIQESMRLIPPVHSSVRVANRDDEIPVSHPVKLRNGKIDEDRKSVSVKKGTWVHVSIEAFNLDKEIWGQDAWEFNPDRWDTLPESSLKQPGLSNSIMTFSNGPRSCIGLRFAMIEVKSFIFLLLTNFKFTPTDDKILKMNVVLTRPYVAGKIKEQSQLPIRVEKYVPDEDTEPVSSA